MRVSGSQQVVPGGISSNVVFHPMKGPMTTQTLRGLLNLESTALARRRTNFLHFNGAFGSLLGGPILSAADMVAYRAFINTVVFQPNPNQNLDRTLPATLGGAIRRSAAMPSWALTMARWVSSVELQRFATACPKARKVALARAGFAGTTGLQGAASAQHLSDARFNNAPARRACSALDSCMKDSDAMSPFPETPRLRSARDG